MDCLASSQDKTAFKMKDFWLLAQTELVINFQKQSCSFSIFLPKLPDKFLLPISINMFIIAISIKVRPVRIRNIKCICFLIKLVCSLKDMKPKHLLFLSNVSLKFES